MRRWTALGTALAAVAVLSASTLVAPQAVRGAEEEYAPNDWSVWWDGARHPAATDAGQITIYVVSGTGVVTFANESRPLASGDRLNLPREAHPRLEQQGNAPFVVLVTAMPR